MIDIVSICEGKECRIIVPQKLHYSCKQKVMDIRGHEKRTNEKKWAMQIIEQAQDLANIIVDGNNLGTICVKVEK